MPFKNEHALLFDIKICERDAAKKKLVSLSLLFCIHFGSKERVCSKRNRTTNVKYFKKPFQVYMYRRHWLLQHSMCWKEYSDLSGSEKAGFFDDNAPALHRNTIKSHFGGSRALVHLFVDSRISDVIIGGMLSQDNDANNEITKECAVSISKTFLMLWKPIML